MGVQTAGYYVDLFVMVRRACAIPASLFVFLRVLATAEDYCVWSVLEVLFCKV